MENWDPVAFKTLLRTTSQRLGQLQERKDSQCQLARRDIATSLSQGHLALARAKAATLIQEEVMGDLLEELEMLVGVVRDYVRELGLGAGVGLGLGMGLGEDVDGEVEGEAVEEKEKERERGGGRAGKPSRLSPALVEAAASIVYAAPSTGSKDLNAVRETLIQRLGPTFAQSASMSPNNHVSPRIMQILSSSPPTASKMDGYLLMIAQTYGVKWVPEPRREDRIHVISEILRVDAGSSAIVDLPRLREICARGLPDDPPWVRPRIWRLLLGTLPVLKTTWAKESQKQRDSYYDLVRRLLDPLASLPSPTDPLSPTDALISRIPDALFCVSPDLFALLGNEPKSTDSGRCPLDPTAPDTVRIPCMSNLDKRLALLQGDSDTCETPEIRLEADTSPPPLPPSPVTTVASRPQRRPTTLLPSKAHNAPPAHRAHLSALLRLLFLHNTLNPAVQSPHVPWLLVPLYSALVGETNEDDVAHAEADTFWVFEALVGEIAEMEEGEGGKFWMRKLSERIKSVDGELATSLHATGLDPVLPHYSYRWLASLLTQTLPLSSVFPVWDVLFAHPMRTRDANPKLEHLVDICTALLIRARTPLFRLGKSGRNIPGLWAQEHMALRPPSPHRPWELSDAFTEGIALLMTYPIDEAGGIDRILQTASDLAQKRIEAVDRERERERENVGFGARIKQQIWKGFTNQVADGSPEEEEAEEEEEEEIDEDDVTTEHDDGNETETPAAPTFTSRFANTVWRGITNQSSMDDEVPSPPSPSSARDSPPPLEEREVPQDQTPSTPSSSTSLWNYAGKLKDSDTVAAFSKVSTNWRAKALDAWRVRKESNASSSSRPGVVEQSTRHASTSSEIAPQRSGWPGLSGADAASHRRGSLPGAPSEDENIISDPPRPAFFRSPRESFLPQPRRQHGTAPPSPNVASTFRDSDTELNTSSFIHRTGTSLAFAAFQSSQPTPRSVPRPLMLNSRDLITNKPPPHQFHPLARSEGSTPDRRGGVGQWGEVLLDTKNRHALKQESISSTSSLSPSEPMNRSPYLISSGRVRSAGGSTRSDYGNESDGSAAAGRRVPLNRKSVSPMALASRSPHLPWNASSPSGGSSSARPLSNGRATAEVEVETAEEHGWRHFEQRAHSNGSVMAATTTTTGFDSPTTIASPPIPRTPLMPAVSSPGVVRIVNTGSTGGRGHGGTSSISALSEASETDAAPLDPPSQSRHHVRKKSLPLPIRSTVDDDGKGGSDDETLASESVDSEMSMSLERTPSGKTPVRLRSKRYVTRPANLRLRPMGRRIPEQRTPSPRQGSLAPEWPGEVDPATTPKMKNHSVRVGEGEVAEEESLGLASSRPPFTRKLSKEVRLRKVSTGSRETRRRRNSGAEEGDDEGYDDLLSAYESEEGSRE